MNSSNSLRFISFFVPTKRTNGQFGARSSASKRLIPMLLYAAASSFVIVNFSLIGIVSPFFILSRSFLMIYRPAPGSFPALLFGPCISRPPLCGASAVGTQRHTVHGSCITSGAGCVIFKVQDRNKSVHKSKEGQQSFVFCTKKKYRKHYILCFPIDNAHILCYPNSVIDFCAYPIGW